MKDNTDHMIEVSEAYDEYATKRRRKRNELMAELEAKLEDEMYEDSVAFAKFLHRKFDAGMTKVELRKATRQYQNPGFKALWDAADYTGFKSKGVAPIEMKFERVEDVAIFTPGLGNWDWSDVTVDRLEFVMYVSENTGKVALRWAEGDTEAALFNAHNHAALNEQLKDVEL